MKIVEQDFYFELSLLRVIENRVEVRMELQLPTESYKEQITLLTVSQFAELLEGIRQVVMGGENRYSSEFEASRLAVLLEKEEMDWVLTWVVAPSMILTNASQAIGIDLATLSVAPSPAIEGQTVEVEMVLSMEELREILVQLEQDYAIMVANQ